MRNVKWQQKVKLDRKWEVHRTCLIPEIGSIHRWITIVRALRGHNQEVVQPPKIQWGLWILQIFAGVNFVNLNTWSLFNVHYSNPDHEYVNIQSRSPQVCDFRGHFRKLLTPMNVRISVVQPSSSHSYCLNGDFAETFSDVFGTIGYILELFGWIIWRSKLTKGGFRTGSIPPTTTAWYQFY